MEGGGRELGGDFLREGEGEEGEEEEEVLSSGMPSLIIFLIMAKQNQVQQQEAKRQGKAMISQIMSKSKGGNFLVQEFLGLWIFGL